MVFARFSAVCRKFAISVIETLRRHGHAAYLVGGCVRDLLLGREPADYDVATDALPEVVMRWARSLAWCWCLCLLNLVHLSS
jgi:tRNA nucleotidyltransferase/poly(A) polymerase